MLRNDLRLGQSWQLVNELTPASRQHVAVAQNVLLLRRIHLKADA